MRGVPLHLLGLEDLKMLYYKVKPEADNKYNRDRSYFFVGGELLTKREKEKYCCPDAFVDPVEIKKTETYWFFGARFAQ